MAKLYHLLKNDVNDKIPGGVLNQGFLVSGSTLAHNRFDLVGKAFLAADLHRGVRILHKPTMVQSALLARVNRTYAFWADRRYEQRAEIEAGLLPLMPAKPVSIVTETVSDLELANMIRVAGIARTLDIAALIEAAE